MVKIRHSEVKYAALYERLSRDDEQQGDEQNTSGRLVMAKCCHKLCFTLSKQCDKIRQMILVNSLVKENYEFHA